MTLKQNKGQALFDRLGLGSYCQCMLEYAKRLAKEKLSEEELHEYFDFT